MLLRSQRKLWSHPDTEGIGIQRNQNQSVSDSEDPFKARFDCKKRTQEETSHRQTHRKTVHRGKSDLQ